MGQFLKKKLIKNCAKQCFEVMVETRSENPYFLLKGKDHCKVDQIFGQFVKLKISTHLHLWLNPKQ